jgi:hypothetical protein
MASKSTAVKYVRKAELPDGTLVLDVLFVDPDQQGIAHVHRLVRHALPIDVIQLNLVVPPEKKASEDR